jgi:hypothetical protein
MTDLAFDINTRELVIQNGQLVIAKDSSVQNGLIIRDAKCVNVYTPILGIGFNPINSQAGSINFELNRWKHQCINDGATSAEFNAKITGLPSATANIDYYISY